MTVVFFSYSHKDEKLRDRLEISLKTLERQNLIESFHDRRIPPGDILDHAISNEIERAAIILLLLSPDFLASAYCMDREVKRALERHRTGEARVIPIILRPCEWLETDLRDLNALPEDGRAITKFPDLDDAFLAVTKGVRQALAAIEPASRTTRASLQSREHNTSSSSVVVAGPRSSNLHLKKSFTDLDRDHFKEQAFEFLAKFFENSIIELGLRNPGIEGSFRRIHTHKFTTSIYRNGKKQVSSRIATGESYFGGDITYAASDTMPDGSFNEALSVQSDDQNLFLKALGMASHRQGGMKLTFEGAAEYLWDVFIGALRQ